LHERFILVDGKPNEAFQSLGSSKKQTKLIIMRILTKFKPPKKFLFIVYIKS